MSTFKKICRFISSILFYSVMLLLVIVVIMFLAYFVDQKIAASKGETRSPLFGAYVIISTSMIPSINVYDAVVTMRVSEADIKINDIITFISEEIDTSGTPITHRVIGIIETENGIMYRTKGDNNNTADFALISPDEVLGKVYLKIPKIGYIQTIMSKPIGWILVVVIPCLFIIFNDIIRLIKGTKKNKENKLKEINEQRDITITKEIPTDSSTYTSILNNLSNNSNDVSNSDDDDMI